jgi:hypothetical protein
MVKLLVEEQVGFLAQADPRVEALVPAPPTAVVVLADLVCSQVKVVVVLVANLLVVVVATLATLVAFILSGRKTG